MVFCCGSGYEFVVFFWVGFFSDVSYYSNGVGCIVGEVVVWVDMVLDMGNVAGGLVGGIIYNIFLYDGGIIGFVVYIVEEVINFVGV